MAESLVIIKRPHPGHAEIVLNDPATRNAMSELMAAEFARAVRPLASDPSLRVVTLIGEGNAFSGGGHLDMLFEKTKVSLEENRRLMEQFYDSFLCVCDLPVPVIAVLNGHAVGAGLCIALACDVRIAVNTAKLGLNFVHLGLHPGMGATYFLPRLVGPARAAELLYAGKIVTAEEGAALGLVNAVVSAQELRSAADRIVGAILRAGPQAIRALKASLRESERRTLAECLAREAECQAHDYVGAEFLEGITAAKEKREPKFV